MADFGVSGPDPGLTAGVGHMLAMTGLDTVRRLRDCGKRTQDPIDTIKAAYGFLLDALVEPSHEVVAAGCRRLDGAVDPGAMLGAFRAMVAKYRADAGL